MDLIDRQQTIAHLKKRAVETAFNNPDSKELVDNVYFELAENRIEPWINEIPSAQSERKKGKWRDYPITDGCLQCSSCGVLRMGEPSNFCPSCGAEMER